MFSSIPLPKPQSLSGDYLDILNEQTNQRLAQEKAELFNQYYGPTAQANALSKIAFAKFVGPQSIGSFLQSPGAANLTPEQYNQLVKQYQQLLTNAQNINLPEITQKNSLWSLIANDLLGGKKQQNAQPTNAILQQPKIGQNAQQEMPLNNLQYPVSNNQNIQPNAQQGTIGRIANQVNVPGTMGGINPTNVARAQGAALQTTATGEAQTQNTLKEKRSSMLSSQSQAATNALKSLEAFNRNYGKSSFKGSTLGGYPLTGPGSIPTLPGHDVSSEQLTDRFANQFLTDLTGLGDTPAGQTDMGRELIASGKVDRSLDKNAQKELYESFKAKLERIIQLRDFANDFYKNNPFATDEQLVAMMNAYNHYAPPYDYESGKFLPENKNKMKDFTSKAALNTYINQGHYNPYEKKSSKETSTSNQPPGKITERSIVNNKPVVKIGNKWYWENP